MTKHFYVGIDLHGTLLNHEEKISEGSREAFVNLMKRKPENIHLYICTGNDLPFVQRKIGDLFDLFDGAVLETGCTVSTDKLHEEVIVPVDITQKIKDLEQQLVSENHPEIYKFARRLATISMFTDYNASLEDFFQKMHAALDLDYARVTRSSVAVDIVPNGYNKQNGLEYFSQEGDVIVALADSLNDLEWLKEADIAYMPGNADLHTVELVSEVKERSNLETDLKKNKLYIAEGNETFGVIQSLEHLFQHYEEL